VEIHKLIQYYQGPLLRSLVGFPFEVGWPKLLQVPLPPRYTASATADPPVFLCVGDFAAVEVRARVVYTGELNLTYPPTLPPPPPTRPCSCAWATSRP
jgi:hypothetical protein